MLDNEERRTKENKKIACGRKHLTSLGVDYDVVTSLSEVAIWPRHRAEWPNALIKATLSRNPLRKLIPSSSVQRSSGFLFVHAAPLLEVKGDPGIQNSGRECREPSPGPWVSLRGRFHRQL